MATTDANLAVAVLDALEESGVEFAVLHGETEIASGRATSDLDLVVATNPIFALERASALLHRAGLSPILAWDYDVAGTVTVFLATSNASEGVQLDLMHDPDGRGRYGARSGLMLASSMRGTRWPTVTPLHQLGYQIRKRHVKRDPARLETLLSEARSMTHDTFRPAVRDAFSTRAAESITALVAGQRMGSKAPYPHGFRYRDSARKLTRIIRPAGFWAEIAGESTAIAAHAVAARFSRLLPRVATSERPRKNAAMQLNWLVSEVAPVRWRAGLFVSSASDPGIPRSDVTLDDGSTDELCSSVVSAMRSKYNASWRSEQLSAL